MAQERFPTTRDWLSGPENREVGKRSLNALLEEAFSALKAELEADSSTQEFINLRVRYGEQLRAWWQSRREIFLQSQKEGKLFYDIFKNWTKIGEEEISVQQTGVYEREDEQVLVITQRTPLEENEITVTVSEKTGLDIFLYPPKISGKARNEPDGDWNTYWELVFRGPAISTITKVTLHDNPDYELPYVKKIETIDASHFGVDNVAKS